MWRDIDPRAPERERPEPVRVPHRDEVVAGAELLGLELDVHIANVVAALQPIAGDLGLPTGAAAD